MNERIQKLIEQATTVKHGVIQPRTIGTVYHFDKEKFIELIVRECIKLCDHESNDDQYDQFDMGMAVKAEEIKASIMKEFGVLE